MLNRFIDVALLIKSQDVHPSDAAPEELNAPLAAKTRQERSAKSIGGLAFAFAQMSIEPGAGIGPRALLYLRLALLDGRNDRRDVVHRHQPFFRPPRAMMACASWLFARGADLLFQFAFQLLEIGPLAQRLHVGVFF